MFFNSLGKFKRAARTAGLRVRLTTRSKANNYYQAVDKIAGSVGYFNTGHAFGMINFKQTADPITDDNRVSPMDREILFAHIAEDLINA